MASIISAGTTSGTALNMSGDTSGILQLATNGTTTAVTIDTSQNLAFNSGYGSVATAYGCRAWVNFNGTGTVAIRASGNVTSITDNGVGDYTVNFTTAMPDANYAIMQFNNVGGGYVGTRAAANCFIGTFNTVGAAADAATCMISVFR